MVSAMREAVPYRSMLFVPANREDLMRKAPRFGPDAVIYDLEDAVPRSAKAEARVLLTHFLAETAAEPIGRFVRLNAWGTGQTVADLLAVVGPGLDGVVLAKTDTPEDVSALDRILTDLEAARGLPAGRTEILPLMETPRGKHLTYEICCASDRIRRATGAGGAVPDGDSARALGLRASADDAPEEYLANLHTGHQARAAGITEILGGMTTKIPDLALVRRLAERARAIGATGSMSIHPSHVAIHNEVFSPSPDDISRAVAVVSAFAAALESSSAAIALDGEMIDYAHVRTAQLLLVRARRFGCDVPAVPAVVV